MFRDKGAANCGMLPICQVNIQNEQSAGLEDPEAHHVSCFGEDARLEWGEEWMETRKSGVSAARPHPLAVKETRDTGSERSSGKFQLPL